MLQRKLILICLVISAFSAVGQKVSIASTYPLNLYEWIENPLLIVVENNACENIVAKVSVGKLTGSKGEYTFVLTDTGVSKVAVTVGIKKNGKIKWIQSIHCRVHKLPTPDVWVSHKTGGGITKTELLARPQIYVPYLFSFEATYAPHKQQVSSYSLKISRNDSTLFELRDVQGDMLTKEMQDFIRYQCKTDDTLVFSDIKILLYRKEKRNATSDITLRLLGND